MYRKADGGGHFAFRQFFIYQRTRETTEGAAAILFGCGHAHQAEFGHVGVDFSWEVVILVPCSGIGGDFAFGEATYHVAYL